MFIILLIALIGLVVALCGFCGIKIPFVSSIEAKIMPKRKSKSESESL
jgi:hypothetical protein